VRTDTYTNGVAYAYTYGDTNGYADSYTYGNSNADAHPNRDADTYSLADLHAGFLLQPGANHHSRQWNGKSVSVEHRRRGPGDGRESDCYLALAHPLLP